jgi:hypothetical protein
MSHSERNEPTLPIGGPELKSEIAANIGLIGKNLVQRMESCGQAGGARGIRTFGMVYLNGGGANAERAQCQKSEVGSNPARDGPNTLI